MEINLVAINLGNSRVAVGSFVAGELGQVRRVPNAEAEQWEQTIEAAWRLIDGRENAAVVAAGVNPPLEKELESAVQRATGRRVVWVGRDLELPMKVLTDKPGETGADRVLNLAAAFEQMGKACVVVDAGTAVTIDCCDDEGKFLGGAIAPGMSMMLDALHDNTAQLPRVEFSVPEHPFGKSTEQAILLGVYHGIRGMVKELVENYATELGRWPDVIATGGDAQALFADWELIHAVAPDLTLYGIALAYANHHLKHGP